MKILVFGSSKERCEAVSEPGTEIEARDWGEEIGLLEGGFLGHIAAHNIIPGIVEAEKNGFDAAVVGCCLDPGVDIVRELVKIPVVGAGEATFYTAAMLTAGKFSVIVPDRSGIPRIAVVARNCGLESRVASWRALGLSVPELMNGGQKVADLLLRAASTAVGEDLAEVICLGCTAFSPYASDLKRQLNVPVLDSLLTGVKMAEFRVSLSKRLQINHSKVGGYNPPDSEQVTNAYNASFTLARKVLYHFKNKRA
jgi:allantoin racemase